MKITAEWLVGFVDGEGSISVAGHGGQLQPRFRLNQRDDDGPVVRAIHKFLGVGSTHARVDRYNPNANPQIVLIVVGRDCARLVEIFDKHPMRSKKRLEYPTWRRAVQLYSRMQGNRWSASDVVARRTKLLLPLAKQIRAIRAYKGTR